MVFFFFFASRRRHTRCSGVSWVQAEDGIRDAQESRGLGDVYKRQGQQRGPVEPAVIVEPPAHDLVDPGRELVQCQGCLLYTSDAADEEDSVDLGGRRIIK